MVYGYHLDFERENVEAELIPAITSGISVKAPSVTVGLARGFRHAKRITGTVLLDPHNRNMSKITRREAGQILGAAAAAQTLNAASDVCFMTAVELAALIRTKKISAREVMDAHLKQIERVNPKVNAIVTLVAEKARENARKADETQARGGTLGPLHGLPVAHKDLVETAGIRTTFGSPIFKDNVPTEDAILVERIRDAGAIAVGKTNTPEFGARFADLQHGIWLNQKSLRPNKNLWRLQRRSGRSASVRYGTDRRRQRQRRFAAKSLRILQRSRIQNLSRSSGVGGERERVVDAKRERADGSQRRRHRSAVERDGRSRSALSDFD